MKNKYERHESCLARIADLKARLAAAEAARAALEDEIGEEITSTDLKIPIFVEDADDDQIDSAEPFPSQDFGTGACARAARRGDA